MTESKHLWLVRHGQTTWNAERRIAGWSDVPLTELGREQARKLRQHLLDNQFDGVWTSDLQRAVATSDEAFGGPAVHDRRLREINFGAYEGNTWESLEPDVRETIMEFQAFRAPKGESVDDLRARVFGFVEELPPGRHLVFCHGGVVRILTRHLGEDRFVPNAALVAVDWAAQRVLFIKNTDAPW